MREILRQSVSLLAVGHLDCQTWMLVPAVVGRIARRKDCKKKVHGKMGGVG